MNSKTSKAGFSSNYRSDKSGSSSIKSIKRLIWLTAGISPKLAAMITGCIYFRPTQLKISVEEIKGIAGFRSEKVILSDGKKILVHSWGAGPKVLLVHGWGGCGMQMRNFVAPLVHAGYQVLMFDAPAHGFSPGGSTDTCEISSAILKVSTAFGPIHCCICHSYGGTSTLYAIKLGFSTNGLVCVSIPDGSSLLSTFSKGLSLSVRTVAAHKAVVEKVYRKLGIEPWNDFSPRALTSGLRIKGLLIHDRLDHYVPLSESQAMLEFWGNARLHQTEGLGHFRILKDDAVIEKAVKFVKELS